MAAAAAPQQLRGPSRIQLEGANRGCPYDDTGPGAMPAASLTATGGGGSLGHAARVYQLPFPPALTVQGGGRICYSAGP